MNYKAVLFDLDGTLLNIDMDYFLKQYFGRMVLMAREQGYQNAEKLVEQVYRSTEQMILNKDPDRTNQEVFEEDFYRSWPYSPNEFNPFFDYFYEQGFPQLRCYCSPFPGVSQMVQGLRKKGCKIVISTNPVFPLRAIEHRLDWAELGHFDFDLVTSFENMHFCKPQIEYYQEIADILGVDAGECLMVGNDVGEDMVAGMIGMKTFLVENMLIDRGERLHADWRGKLDALYSFFREIG